LNHDGIVNHFNSIPFISFVRSATIVVVVS